MSRAAFIYEDALSRHELRSDHPMRPVRLRYTYELLQEYGAFDHPEAVLLDPRSATDEELAWLHTSEYVAAVKALGSGSSDGVDGARFGFSGQGDNPVYPNMFEAAALSTGGSLLAAEMVNSGEVAAAFNISGGLHHATAGHASKHPETPEVFPEFFADLLDEGLCILVGGPWDDRLDWAIEVLLGQEADLLNITLF